ncbi:MAG: alkaline shock response membrane anchor protein AmaP [Acidaminococcaceae bacterium]|nr:alkaline shock response membrane anchor protein AmaP [Acidaminococcaceae bacterium]
MSIFDRIILALYTVFMACVSVITVLCSLDVIPHRYISAFIAGIPGNTFYCIGGVILFLVSLRLLIANVTTTSGSLLLSDSGHGKVEIDKGAIEDYAASLAQEIYGIFNVKVIAKLAEEGIYVRINASIEPGIVIPDTSEEVRANVREGLKKATGVEVKDIEIYFKQIKVKE